MIAMMTVEDMRKELKRLEDEKFYLTMKDRWNRLDFEEDERLHNEIKKLKEMLDK